MQPKIQGVTFGNMGKQQKPLMAIQQMNTSNDGKYLVVLDESMTAAVFKASNKLNNMRPVSWHFMRS